MKHLSRMIIWLIILLSPTMLWFYFTDDGQDAWQQFFFSLETTKHAPVTIKKVRPDNNNITLVPAAPPATKPRLQISITAKNTQGTDFPFTVFVMDKNRNKSGFDSSTQQIKNQLNSTKLNINDKTLTIDIHPATSIKYALKISGNPGGYFRLAVGGVSPTMESSTTIQEGHAAINRKLHYNIDLSKLRNIGFGTQMRQASRSQFISQPTITVSQYKQVSLKETCQNILKKLERVPDGYVMTSKGKDCDYTFHGTQRNKSFVSPADLFYPYTNSQAFADGWIPGMEAGGPDGSYFQIKNDPITCQVSGSWDGGLDDDPTYVPGNDYSISIACSEMTAPTP